MSEETEDGCALLASTVTRVAFNVDPVVLQDGRRHGAVAMRVRPGLVRRAEPGPCGPFALQAQSTRRGVECEVWGPTDSPPEAVDQAMEWLLDWIGARDDPSELHEAVAGHRRARDLAKRVGEVRIGRIPRVGEAVSRAVICQRVQGKESQQSILHVAARAGRAAPRRLWTWPTAAELGAFPKWELRGCGVSVKGATALHAAAVHDRRLAEAVGDWDLLDRRLRMLPGVGVWTAGETRAMLGDRDAVSIGDYHLPSWVGVAIGDPTRPAWRGYWSDDDLLETLAPFAGQRGRVIRLCELAIRAGIVRRPPRRAPRAKLSAHRYW